MSWTPWCLPSTPTAPRKHKLATALATVLDTTILEFLKDTQATTATPGEAQ